MIDVKNLSCTLKKIPILNNVNFKFSENFFYSIFGKSGSGKSTLLKCLVNLVPYNGEIFFDNKKLAEYSPYILRSNIIYLHQEPVILGESVEDDLNIVFNLGVNRKKIFDKKSYLKNLSIFGYDETFLRKKKEELSGGQKQIAAILRSIALNPKIILLDEPTSALDINTENKLIDLIKSYKNKILFITVSHSLNLIKSSDIKLLFKNGTIHEKYEQIDDKEIKKVLI